MGLIRKLIRPSYGSSRAAAGALLAAGIVGSLLAASSQAAVFTLPPDSSSLIGADQQIQSQAADTLLDLARKYSVGYWEIQEANPKVDMWLPGQGTALTIPGRFIVPPVDHKGIVINLPQHRMFYFPKAGRHDQPIVITYPVSPGEGDFPTPVGVTRIVRKVPHPIWIPTAHILKAHEEAGDPIPRVWKAGPDNPMGEWALETTLSHGEIYIHGTNNPMAIGMSVTHGCVRLYPEDIAALYPVVRVGTPVTIVNEPVLASLQDGDLYLEVHPPTNSNHVPAPPDLDQISQIIDAAIGKNVVAIDWDQVRQVATQANGIPQLIGVEAYYGPPDTPPGKPAGTQTAPTQEATLSGPHHPTSGSAGAT
ncbi:MAG TPA: L,D-transpeptidase family protein [Steroidobacteraceae bacterium]|jgi:L,D-transpeptidase ErfK/SrfK|nr:L,D-transpeptidase family protein [Steroidobacteraceae bacterium]